MEAWLTGIVWVVLSGAIDILPPGTPWLRTADPLVAEAIRVGHARSATFRAVSERVRRADAIVYFVRKAVLPRRVRAALHPEVNGTVPRYLRVFVRPGEHGVPLVAAVAHELQHAAELLQAGNARTPTECEALFRRIGYQSGPGTLETVQAIATGDAVLSEMRAAYLSGGRSAWPPN